MSQFYKERMPAPERPAAGAFVLAPTPAQLGRAPLQRRLGSSGSAGEPPPATAAARRPSAGASTPAATATSGAQPTATSAAAAARRSPDHMDKVLEQVNFSEKFTRLPQFRPGEIPSPSALSPRVTPSQRRRRKSPLPTCDWRPCAPNVYQMAVVKTATTNL
ncbi:Protein capicua [Amphibalanus amphitrite]|uniref:Protein capicua n=1 Tax=Amphibalanus amphitrite TaxID=1232801 RepID=A0A6A4V9R3_AMPAM|nr:Protein capicua [Amphibalanus amphitrite]